MSSSQRELLLRSRQPLLLFEKWLLLGLLTIIIALPVIDILSRELPFFTFSSSSLFLKYLMVWFTMVAGSLASQNREHLSLAVFEHLLPERIKQWTRPLTAYIVSVIIFSIAYSSLGYVKLISADHPPIGIVPMWVALSILPIGFSVMGVRTITTAPFSYALKIPIFLGALATPVLL